MRDWIDSAALGATFYRPVVPVTVLLLLVLVAAGAWAWLYLRHSRGGGSMRPAVLLGCRLMALAVLAWLLMGPSTLDALDGQGLRPGLDILIDNSASMSETDALPGDPHTTRLDALRQTWLSPQTLAAFETVSRPRLIAFDEQARTIGPEEVPKLMADGNATALLDSIARVRSRGTDAGSVMLVLSDGHDTRGGPDRAMLDRLATGGPIFAVPVGQVRDAADVAIHAWADADFLFDGQQTTLRASLIQRGFDGRMATIDLLADDRLIASQRVRLDAATLRESFTVTAEAEPGLPVTPRHYRLQVSLEDDGEPEAYTANNTADVFVQVSRQRVKAVLFEGRPYWDTQAIARALSADPQVELTTVYQVSPGRTAVIRDGEAEADPAGGDGLLPMTQATLNGFDVVILGRGCEVFFGGERAQMLGDFVRMRGGALVLARGQPFGPSPAGREAQRRIEPLLPVTWGNETARDLRLALTEAGEGNPLLAFDRGADGQAVVTRLPGMIAATRVERERAASVVLLRQSEGTADQGMAAVATMRVGGGRVLAVLTDGLWRWSLLPTVYGDDATVYQVFWSRAIQWLATGGQFLPGQEVSLALDRLSVEPGRPIEATVATRYVIGQAFEPHLRIIGPDGQTTVLHPRRDSEQSPNYRTVIEAQATGVYRLELFDAGPDGLIDPASPMVSRFVVADRSPERLDPSAMPQVLEAIAEATGGACLGLDETQVLYDHLQALHTARQSDVHPRYDFDRWPVLLLIGLALGAEWFVRRRGGML